VDKEIGPILSWLAEGPEQPPWEKVALSYSETKTLWAMCTRLSIQDGVLRRRFEEIDGLNIRWQILIPKKYRYEFLKIAHEGMTGGHLGYAKTSDLVQS